MSATKIREKVNSIAELRALVNIPVGKVIETDSYYGDGNGGGNTFIKVADTGQTDNGGTVIAAADAGFYEADIKNNTASIKQFGGKGDGDESNVLTGNDSDAYERLMLWQDEEDGNTAFIDEGVFNLRQKELTLTKEIRIKGGDKYKSVLFNTQSINYSKSIFISDFTVSFCQDTVLSSPYKYQIFLDNQGASSTDDDYIIDVRGIHTYRVNKLIRQDCSLETDMPNVNLTVLYCDFEELCTGVIKIEGVVKNSLIADNKVHDIYNLQNALRDIQTDPLYSNAGSELISNPGTDITLSFTGFSIGKQPLDGISRSDNIIYKNNSFDHILVGVDWTYLTPDPDPISGETSIYCVLTYSSNSTAEGNKFTNCERSLYMRGGGNRVKGNTWVNDSVWAIKTVIWKSGGEDSDTNPLIIEDNAFIGDIYSGLTAKPSSNLIIRNNHYDISNDRMWMKENVTGVLTEYPRVANPRTDFISYTETDVLSTTLDDVQFTGNYINIRDVYNLSFLYFLNKTDTSIRYDISDNTFLGIHTTANYYSIRIDNDAHPDTRVDIRNNYFSGMLCRIISTDRVYLTGNTQVQKNDSYDAIIRAGVSIEDVDTVTIEGNRTYLLSGNGGFFEFNETPNIIFKGNNINGAFPLRIDDYSTTPDVNIDVVDNYFSESVMNITTSNNPVVYNMTIKVVGNTITDSFFRYGDDIEYTDRINEITFSEWKDNTTNTVFTHLSTIPTNLKMITSFSTNDSLYSSLNSTDILSCNTSPIRLNKPGQEGGIYPSSYYIYIKSITYNYNSSTINYTGDTDLVIVDSTGTDIFATINISGGSVSGTINIDRVVSFDNAVYLTTQTSDPLSGDGVLDIEMDYEYNWINNELSLPTISTNEKTGSELDLSIASYYNMASPSSSITYTTSILKLGGSAACLINTTSEPTVTGGTKTTGSTWVTGTDMYMIVWYTGVRVEYYFLEI